MSSSAAEGHPDNLPRYITLIFAEIMIGIFSSHSVMCVLREIELLFSTFGIGARVFLGGSSLNGFGSRTSDADLCLVFEEGSVSVF